MKRKNRNLILGTVAVTTIGVAGASVAASGTEQPGSATNEVVVSLRPHAANVDGVRRVTAPGNGMSEVEAENGNDATDEGLESQVAISGTDLEKAAAAALAYTGNGRVTETEIEDEESYYEVEVTLDDGRQIDVQLDENFKVVGSESDGSGGS